MNQQNVAKREVLDYKEFLGKVHDNTYKPLSPAHQSEGGLEKSGLSQIKREPAYDFVGYADAVFGHQSIPHIVLIGIFGPIIIQEFQTTPANKVSA